MQIHNSLIFDYSYTSNTLFLEANHKIMPEFAAAVCHEALDLRNTLLRLRSEKLETQKLWPINDATVLPVSKQVHGSILLKPVN